MSLERRATIRKFLTVQIEGKREVFRSFEKYRIVQDRLFENDFDIVIKEMAGQKNKGLLTDGT